MERPYKYTVWCNKTNTVVNETNVLPLIHHLKTKERVSENSFREVVTKTVFEDVRYEAKLRLYNYITYTKKGLEIPQYKPIQGEVGKSIPILNF